MLTLQVPITLYKGFLISLICSRQRQPSNLHLYMRSKKILLPRIRRLVRKHETVDNQPPDQHSSLQLFCPRK